MNLSNYELELLKELICRLTGTQRASFERLGLTLTNLSALWAEESISNFQQFLVQLNQDPALMAKFISRVTNHTTSWFREPTQFDEFERKVRALHKKGQTHFRIWSAACSSGQETYTICLIFEKLIREGLALSYSCQSSDIDSESLAIARAGRYPAEQLSQIPQYYQGWITLSKDQKSFSISPEVQKNCRWFVQNLDTLDPLEHKQSCDFIFCRNVLIYFSAAKASQIIEGLSQSLVTGGILYISLTENISGLCKTLNPTSQSGFEKKDCTQAHRGQGHILLIDDVAVARLPLKMALTRNGFQVTEASSAEEADLLMARNTYDLVTLDLNLPGEDGARWLRKIRAQGNTTPVIIVSSSDPSDTERIFGILIEGAQEYFVKNRLAQQSQKFIETVQAIVQQRSQLQHSLFIPSLNVNHAVKAAFPPRVVVIGSSTGGPQAIWRLLAKLPKPFPPIVIVQHTNEFYAPHFAQSLEKSGFQVKGSRDGEPLQMNCIFVAHGDYHLELEENNGALYIRHSKAEPRHGGLRPCVDLLFESLAKVHVPSVAILLTGMGSDGARGMQALAEMGSCFNFAQSEESCAIYGMPKEAIARKAVHSVGAPEEIAEQLMALMSQDQAKKRVG